MGLSNGNEIQRANSGDLKKSIVKQITESEAKREPLSVQLFASLDLVNSTAFKAKTYEWPDVWDLFYTRSEVHLCGDPGGDTDRFRIWKYAGDEVLFHQPVIRLGDIPRSIDLVFKKVHEISREIASLCKKEEYPTGLLDIKATVWIALIHTTVHHPTDCSRPERVCQKGLQHS